MRIGIGIGIPFSKVLESGGAPPVNTVAPAVSGVAIVSQVLTTTNGTWTGTPTITFTYQWQRSTDGGANFSNISLATSSTYTLVAGDASYIVRCQVTASNGVGSPVIANSNNTSIRATILDMYSTNVERCYYLTLQRGAYYGSPCIRVRRSGDNSETNIGFTTTGALDTSSLTAFVIAGGGTQNGFIVTYYDQSTNARNATQATPSKQAQIVASGAIMTNAGLTISDYVATASQGDYAVTAVNLSAYTIYHYNQLTLAGSAARAITGQSNIWAIYHALVGDGFRDSSGYEIIANPPSFNFVKRAYVRNGANGELYYNAVSQGTKSTLDTGTNSFNIFMNAAFGTYTNDKIRGTIVYGTNHNSTIISAINNLLD